MKFFKIGVFIFVFFCLTLATLGNVQADCNYPNYCNAQPQDANASNPKPGDNCTINGAPNASYKYGTSSRCGLFLWDTGPCVPKCGFLGSGYCCEPKDKNKPIPPSPSPYLAPPCKTYANGTCASVDTAFGPIQTTVAGFVKSTFGILLGLSGGVAILLVIAAGYQMITSQGNPEKVKEARERLTAAIVGLIFIIFSVVILQFIGVDILQIPGFRK